MTAFEANLAALYGRHPALKGKKLEEASGGDFQILPSACGAPTALAGGTYLHSRYDPAREARRLLEQQIGPRISAGLFFGFGLGYLVEAFRSMRPQVPIAVVEPDLGLFVQALRCRDLTALLSCELVSWHLGQEPEEAVMGLDGLPLSSPQIIRLRPVYLLKLSYYRRLELLVQALLDRREVNLNTLRRFGRLWVRNLLNNLDLFVSSLGVSRLEGLFQGFPALVLAAGPSLDLVLPHLKQLRERMLLVAVDTSYVLCRRAGVEPDFLVTVDPQYWNTRHLDWTDFREVVLISESSAHPRIFHRLEEFQRPLYFVSSFFPIGQFLEDIAGHKGLVGAGGSVSTTAWDLARLLGAGPLFMAGLDLGFPGRRTHSRGAFFEEATHIVSGRLLPAEQMGFRYLTEAGLFAVKANSGSLTLTDRRMVIYKWWFENQMKQIGRRADRPETKTYSLAPEGVRIEGMPYRPLDSLLALPAARSRMARMMRLARSLGKLSLREPDARQLDRVRAALSELAEDLERLERLAADGLALCAAVPPNAEERGRALLMEGLNELDRQILQLSARQVAGFLFQPLIRKILDCASESGTFRGMLELSEELYRELGFSASYQAGLMRRALVKR